MTKLVSRILASAAFLCAFVLLPSSSQATIEPNDIVLIALDAGDVQSDAPVCNTINTCSFPDPTFGGAYQPAISFDMSQDQTVHIEADIYDGFSCLVFNGTAMGDLPLTAGHHIVFIGYNPPLDPGTEISVVWRLDGCAATACTDYCIGNYPDICT